MIISRHIYYERKKNQFENLRKLIFYLSLCIKFFQSFGEGATPKNIKCHRHYIFFEGIVGKAKTAVLPLPSERTPPAGSPTGHGQALRSLQYRP